MQRLIEVTVIIGLLSVAQLAHGGSIPDDYNTGDTLTADKMNNIKSAVNDNDDRVSALEAAPRANTVPGAPGPTDDINAGYPVGSVWVDLIDRQAYILVDDSPGAAVWEPVTNAPRTYAIGDTGPGGGIVFFVTNGGLHGLEAAPADLAGTFVWGCVGSNIPGAERTNIGTGATNTADIRHSCAERPIAASAAAEYEGPNQSTLGGGWFLPSSGELLQMYLQRNAIGGFGTGFYWSSSESPTNSFLARFVNFSQGVISVDAKNFLYRVRPIRAF